MERKTYGNKRVITRDKILSAAAALFAEKGIAMSSAKEIANLAGISVGLMYHYYKTKEEVFGELVKISLEELKELKAMVDEYNCPLTALNELAEEIILGLSTSYEFSQWSRILSHPLPAKHDPEWAAMLLSYHVQFVEQMASLVVKGQKAGKFKEGNPAMLAQALIALVDGLCGLQLALKDKFVIPSADIITALIIKE